MEFMITVQNENEENRAKFDVVFKEPKDIEEDFLDAEVVSQLYSSWITMESSYISHIQLVLRDELS